MTQNKTVAITGTHPGTRAEAPYHDPNVDIWVFNEAFAGAWCQRFDAVFQMHASDIYRSPLNRNDPEHYKHLREIPQDKAVYMQVVDDTIPASVKYPLEYIARKYLAGQEFFLSSIDYALALALYLEYDKILIYGVEMASNTEYHYQRQGVRLWLGIAHALGVDVEIHCGLDVFDRVSYGYGGIITQDIEKIDAQVRALELEAQHAADHTANQKKRLARACITGNKLSVRISELLDAKRKQGELDGRLAELKRYQFKLHTMRDLGEILFLDRNELEMGAGKTLPKIEEHTAMIHRTAGRIDYVAHVWEQTKQPVALEQIKQFTNEHVKAGYDAGYYTGVYKTNHEMASAIDDAIAAAGGDKAVQITTGEIYHG